jgi:hypothetical protein
MLGRIQDVIADSLGSDLPGFGAVGAASDDREAERLHLERREPIAAPFLTM